MDAPERTRDCRACHGLWSDGAVTTPIGPGAPRSLLVGLLTSVVAVAFESVAVATAMPQAARDLGRIGLYAWAFTMFVLGMVVATAIAGRIVDRIGPVWPVLGGQALFVIGLVAAGSATSMPMLIAARFGQGLGGGAFNLAFMVVIARAYDPAARARVMTAFSVCWTLPAFVGPFVAGWLTDHLSWHWVFWSVAPVMVLAMLVMTPALLSLRSTEPPPADDQGVLPAPVPVWASLVTGAGVAGVQYGGTLGGARGLAVALVAVAALVAGVPRLMPPGFLRLGRGLVAVVWARLLLAGAFFASESFLPLMLVEQRHMSLTRAGLAITVGSLGWTFGSWLQSRSWLSWRRDVIVVVGVVHLSIGLALVTTFARFPALPLAVPAIGWVLAGVGMGMAVASTSLVVMALSPGQLLGRNSSSLQVGDGLGTSILGGVAGAVFAALHGKVAASHTFGTVFAVGLVAAAASILVSVRVGAVVNESRDSDR